MKGSFSLLFLMMTIFGFAQDTTSTANAREMQTTLTTAQMGTEPVAYMLDDLEFLFIPEGIGYRIARIQDGREVDYGSLHQTTDDGYFVLTSRQDDHVSYGRFDQQGNFKALRYDEASEHVVEELFVKKD